MLDPMKNVLSDANRTLTDELMRGCGNTVDEVRRNGAAYQADVRYKNGQVDPLLTPTKSGRV
jgi:hypothetical protein